MSEVVPDDVLRDILSRLPVAPLLRYRCVSKSWKGLIDSDQFIKHHLNHSRTTNSNLNILFKTRSHIYSADFELLNATNQANFQKLSPPLETFDGSLIQIVGSCDGLLVLRNQGDGLTILWNPSIRRFHAIHSTRIEFPRYISPPTFYGFGYDVVSDDYKLLRIVQFIEVDDSENFDSEVKVDSEAKVYSLKTNSWRRIPDFPFYIRTNGCLVNGALHWIVSRKVIFNSDNLVGAFDLGTEEYRLVPLPNFAGDVTPRMDMLVLGGCLSLMCYDANENHVDLWVMHEYGVQESWSILLAFDTHDLFLIKPLVYSMQNRKLLLELDNQGFTWYDLDKESTDVPMLEMPSGNISDRHTCLQSFVLMNNGTRDSFYFVWTDKMRKYRTRYSKRARQGDVLFFTVEE